MQNATVTEESDMNETGLNEESETENVRLCSGLAGEINRPQFLFYPLIESSNIPRYN
jgi:hypothetical protein